MFAVLCSLCHSCSLDSLDFQVSLVSFGLLRILLHSLGFSRIPRFFWILSDFLEIFQILPGPLTFSRILFNFPGFFRIHSSSHDFFQILPNFFRTSRLYCIVSHSSGLFLNSLSYSSDFFWFFRILFHPLRIWLDSHVFSRILSDCSGFS